MERKKSRKGCVRDGTEMTLIVRTWKLKKSEWPRRHFSIVPSFQTTSKSKRQSFLGPRFTFSGTTDTMYSCHVYARN